MSFDIDIWNSYVLKAKKIGKYINRFRDAYGYTIMNKKELKECLNEITLILSQLSNYLNKNNLKMPPPKWVYDVNDTTTHASSPDFKYKHLI